MSPRVRLVETSEALPGLLTFPAWDALGGAGSVLVRDRRSHPAAGHLYFAGLDVVDLEPATLDPRQVDLTSPGTPRDRGLAKALVDLAEETGESVFLLGPEDDALPRVVGYEAAKRDIEVEFVLLAGLPAGTELVRMTEVMRQLRDPDHGCPWDLKQDHDTLKRYLIEESYELLEAIESGDDEHIQEELGDVLLQVLFHAQVAADRGAFTIDDVAKGLADKLIRRHPHVFADGEADTAEEVQQNWDRLKQEEKQRTGPFDGVPRHLPALMLAEEQQKKAAKLGFDYREPSEPESWIHQELEEIRRAETHDQLEEEIGDLIGATVGLARTYGVDPEAAMRRAAAKFRRRFEDILALAESEGSSPDELDRDAWLDLWDRVKDLHAEDDADA